MNSVYFTSSKCKAFLSKKKITYIRFGRSDLNIMSKFSQKNYIMNKNLFLALNESHMHLVSNISDLRLKRIRKIKILASFYTLIAQETDIN